MIAGKTVVYTSGTFDMLHINHLRLIEYARGLGDILIVGVNTDELVASYKSTPMIPFEDRIEIVRSCKYVDAVIPQYDMDKLKVCKEIGATYMFVGDDWYGTDKWKKYEEEFGKEGVKIVYFPYTRGVSSTKITEALKQVRGWTSEESMKASEKVEGEWIGR